MYVQSQGRVPRGKGRLSAAAHLDHWILVELSKRVGSQSRNKLTSFLSHAKENLILKVKGGQ